jgi:hypothetical protein
MAKVTQLKILKYLCGSHIPEKIFTARCCQSEIWRPVVYSNSSGFPLAVTTQPSSSFGQLTLSQFEWIIPVFAKNLSCVWKWSPQRCAYHCYSSQRVWDGLESHQCGGWCRQANCKNRASSLPPQGPWVWLGQSLNPLDLSCKRMKLDQWTRGKCMGNNLILTEWSMKFPLIHPWSYFLLSGHKKKGLTTTRCFWNRTQRATTVHWFADLRQNTTFSPLASDPGLTLRPAHQAQEAFLHSTGITSVPTSV